MVPEGPKAWYQSPWPIHCFVWGLAVAWLLAFGNPLETHEKQWFDHCLRWRFSSGLAPTVDPRIVHLDITQEDLALLPDTESEYSALAGLIRETTDLGAELLVLDTVYHRGTPEMAQPILEAVRGSRGVIFSEGLHGAPGSSGPGERIRSFPFLSSPVSPAGLINIQADRDGVYRHYSYLQRTSSGPEPSVALAAYWKLRGIRWPDEVTFREGDTALWQELSKDGTRLVPRQWRAEGRRLPLLDFRSGWTSSGPSAFPHLTLAKLHEMHRGRLVKGAERPLSGKILFVAYVASGISDFGATPFGAHEPLVHLHSTALNDLLQKTSHWRVPLWADLLAVSSILLLCWGSTLCRGKAALFSWWFFGVLIVFGMSMALVLKTEWVIGSVFANALYGICLVAELARRHSLEFLERFRLRTTVGYYFSPRVLERVLANPGSMEPQQVELTVLLTDLRNFTAISERVGTRGVFSLCNQVFELETKAVTDEDGSLEHFLGDQFLSYWGAPDSQPDGADRALRASFALMRSMEELRGRLAPGIRELFGYGVALHSGTAMIGNKGSRQRLDYGVMGDLINSTARVESLTKHYGVPFLVTRETYNRFSERSLFRFIDVAMPVGKSTAFELFEIESPLSSPHFETVARHYNAAFEEYRRGNFSRARDAFEHLTREYQDPPSRLLAHRCEELTTHPPELWDGVYHLTSK